MSGKKMMIHTELLKFYLELGLSVTHIYQAIEYKGCDVFKPFADLIMGYRREALRDSDMVPKVQMYKTLGNSAYGSLLIYKFKFLDIHYLQGDRRVLHIVNCKRFKKMSVISQEDNLYECEMAKNIFP